MRAVFAALVLLGACTSAPRDLPPPNLPERAGTDPIVAARADGVVFRAVGASPDFVLHIHRNDAMIYLSWDGGAQEETFNQVRVVLPAYRGTVYEANTERHDLRVEIRQGVCRDPNLGPETFSASVTVRIDGVVRRGCGREL